MASSHNHHYFWGPHDPDSPSPDSTSPVAATTATPSATHSPANGSPHLSFTPAPMPVSHSHPSVTPVTSASPPSPNDISAAAILATLADSRPTTSHEDHEPIHGEEMDDGQPGGIALDSTDDESAWTYEPTIMSAPPTGGFVPIEQLVGEMVQYMQTSGLSNSLENFPPQHSAAHEYLTSQLGQDGPFTPFPDIFASASASSVPSQEMDMEASSNLHEEFLSVTGKDAFLSITTFFNHFIPHKDTPIALDAISPPDAITRQDLYGDSYDIQGIDWTLRNTTRSNIRSKRFAYESSRLEPHLLEVRQNIRPTPNTENYFAFKRINTAHQAFIPHFQLRNLLATASHNDIYYAERDVVLRTDASGASATTIQDLTKERFEGNRFHITTLATSNDVLIAGGFEGEYALTNLASAVGTPTTVGRINNRTRDSKSHITNHIHLTQSRHTYTPQAILSSNDNRLRILDVYTNTFTNCFTYSHAVNCSASSPDGRLRVVVGDFRETLITNAETGQPFEALKTHTDDAFACDWADDGIHVATAAQDSTIVVWDARNWSRPLKTLRSELSIPRCLRFSPVGGGPRVLVSAEADDYVNIINAQTFESRQLLDFFGRTGGISMTPDGSSLFVANSDPNFGGIMEYDRCGWGERRVSAYDEDFGGAGSAGLVSDWAIDEDLDDDSRVVCSWRERSRRGLDLASLVV